MLENGQALHRPGIEGTSKPDAAGSMSKYSAFFPYTSSRRLGVFHEAFSPGYLDRHPELDPRPFLNAIKAQGGIQEVIMLEFQMASAFFTEKSEKCWRGNRPGHEFDIHDGMLDFYRYLWW